MLFKLNKVSKSYAAHPVLRDVSFQINPGERVGLVGRNGAGKSTVFRLISGLEMPDEGTVEKSGGLRIGMLDQHVAFGDGETVLSVAIGAFEELVSIETEMRRLETAMTESDDQEILDQYADLQIEFERKDGFGYRARAEAVLHGLRFGKEDFDTPVAQLSGGQKNRLGMARLLLTNCDLLLLDEPTNHLDVETVEWLEDFLVEREGAYIVVSHDRYFLDRTCRRIIEIEFGTAFSYAGNYSKYIKDSTLRKEQMQREFENQQAFISKTEAFIRKNLAGQKTKQAKSRRNMLSRLDRKEAAISDDKAADFRISNVVRSGNDVLRIKDLTVGYPGKTLGAGIDLSIQRGDCLGVIGGNGTGKSTFLKTILGEIREVGGEILWGTKIQRGYYSQELESLSSPNNDVIGELRTVAPDAETGDLRSFLAAFLFSGEDVFKKVGDLSGGEKGRLALAKLIYSGVNVLILDEPTNHLDILSREALESALGSFEGTVITVSHDRFFLDKIVNQIVWFSGEGRVENYFGNYSEFHNWFADQQLSDPDDAVDHTKNETDAAGKPEEKESFSKNEIAKMQRRLEEIELAIESKEEEVVALEQDLTLADVIADREKLRDVNKKYEDANRQLETLHSEWEELVERIPG